MPQHDPIPSRAAVTVADSAPLTVGDAHIKLLPHGPDRLATLLDTINTAHTSIRLLFYMFCPDAAGTAVRDALLAAAQRGVTVTMLIDSFGSSSTPNRFFDPIRDAGGTVRWFGTRWTPRYLIRNHQKLVVVDDTICISGGFNVADSYFAPPDDAQGWADIGFILTGPPVAPMMRWFDSLAEWMARERPRFRDLRRLVRHWHDDTPGTMQWVVGGPAARLSPWSRALRAELKPGRRLAICMAYFAPNAGMLRRIVRVARGGGSVSILLPSRGDNPATVGAARLLYKYLIKRGVEIAEFQPQLLHAKLIVVDDVVLIGSANCDMRSLYINLELMLRVEDADFAAACLAIQHARLAQAQPITLSLLQQWATPLTRLRWFMSWLVVTVADYSVTRRLNFGLGKAQR